MPIPAGYTSGQIVQAVVGTGKILQVMQATKNNAFSTTSATFVDVTDLSVSITPSATTSKILVFSSVTIGQVTGDGLVRLMRDSTAIAAGTTGTGIYNGFGMTATTYNNQYFTSSVTFLDSPTTTSATTYKIQGVCNTGTLYVNRRGADTTYGGFSSITVMEISG